MADQDRHNHDSSVLSQSSLPQSSALAEAKRDLYIVGVGASAGGLEALELMFRAMPSDTGMAFVIVQHLSPDFKSLMDELLARHTSMPIHRVTDGMQVEPNSLYLIPPKQDMIISNGRLLLTEKDSSQSLSLPIDHFFRSLAQDVGPHSIAVVLSGTGSDGSRGIRDVNAAGGLVIAQIAESAKFDGMPKSAIDTNLVDAVVPPEEVGDVLRRYLQNPSAKIIQQARGTIVDESSIAQVYRLLQRRHSIDFNDYKSTTIGRRMERRIQLDQRCENIEQYVRRLESDPSELDQLYMDLLIGVTQFFRDPDAFDSLSREFLPHLLDAWDPSEEFRVWVAACATGEEAYTLAILLDEVLAKLGKHVSVKIFATDVHQKSIDFAHAGTYSEASMQDLTAERRDRYFRRSELGAGKVGYTIVPELRKQVVFAPHNLVSDAPFTRLSLITCRNMLIYLRRPAQKKVLSLFHFGLKAGGLLMLGPSETPSDLSGEFDTVNEHWRIFRKSRDIRLPTAIQGTFGFEMASFNPPSRERSPRLPNSHDAEMTSVYNELLGRFMPPAILVEQNRQIVQIFGGAGKYLSYADGRLSSSLGDVVHGDLKLALTGAIQRCVSRHEPVCYERLRIEIGDKVLNIRLTVFPVKQTLGASKFIITFEELDQAEQGPVENTELMHFDDVSRDQLSDLQHELEHTKENLQATVEEMETSNEELQATNEELVASNEELQSTNEELHSVNEELFTVNAEFQKKIVELTELTNDVNNLLISTEVHTLFLDSKLNVRKFTPRMADVFNLVPHDVGRRIDAFAHNINCQNLFAHASQVMISGKVYEQRVQDNQGSSYLLRILPYLADEQLSGVVITLVDIKMLIEAQEAVVNERERFGRVIAANGGGIWDWPDLHSDLMWWSPGCYELLGYEPNDFPSLHSEWLARIHPEDRKRIAETTLPSQEACFVELHREFEYRMMHKSGEYRWYCHRAIVEHDAQGKATQMAGSVSDIHARKIGDIENIEGIRLRDNFLSMLSHELRNPMGAVLNALQCAKLAARNVMDSTTACSSKPSPGDVLAVIERQTRHMARLLDDLLDVARFGHGKIEFRKELVDLRSLANLVVEALSYEISQKQQKLHLSYEDGPVCVYGDPARLKQAQVNLLVNASKYSPPGSEIFYEIRRDGDNVLITVRDCGAGISPELLANVFDLFVQGDDTLARSSGGLGVGLSLAKSIIEAHDGTICATSDGEATGSEFKITMPIVDRIPEPQKSEPEHVFNGCRLLLVEDNQDARSMLAAILRMKGFDVGEAEDGATALKRFSEFRPEVAVIDIGLPGVDGYELARQLRERPEGQGTFMVALTGYARETDRNLALQAGFDAHLSKPLDHRELFKQIAQRGLAADQR